MVVLPSIDIPLGKREMGTVTQPLAQHPLGARIKSQDILVICYFICL